MQLKRLHSWDLEPRAAIALQTRLADQLISDAPLDLARLKLVAGVDVSVKSGVTCACIVVVEFPDLTPVETVCARQPTNFPYVPGLLAFREAPTVLEAAEELSRPPDVFLFDGMGQLHPRRLGIAAHLGLWLGMPTVGCGKSHYIGDYAMPAAEKGSFNPVLHRGEQIGVVLRTRDRVKPVYVSAGHLIDLKSAVELTLACAPRFRLPEPIRLAHKAAAEHCVGNLPASVPPQITGGRL